MFITVALVRNRLITNTTIILVNSRCKIIKFIPLPGVLFDLGNSNVRSGLESQSQAI